MTRIIYLYLNYECSEHMVLVMAHETRAVVSGEPDPAISGIMAYLAKTMPKQYIFIIQSMCVIREAIREIMYGSFRTSAPKEALQYLRF